MFYFFSHLFGSCVTETMSVEPRQTRSDCRYVDAMLRCDVDPLPCCLAALRGDDSFMTWWRWKIHWSFYSISWSSTFLIQTMFRRLPTRAALTHTPCTNRVFLVVFATTDRAASSTTPHHHYNHQVIATKETGTEAPVKRIENCSFLYTRHMNMFFVAMTRSNVNPALVFEYLFQLIRILKGYLGDEFDENAMRNNMTLIYELMDETMDFGYPQNCAVDVLRLYINLGNVKPQDEPEPSQLTSQITGAIDWRREGIRHKKNEVYIDVLESVNLLLSSTGNVLRNEVTGGVQMNTKLTGMPECKFGLNDKLVIEKEGQRKPGVEIDDCTFHRCVRLGKFDADRTITFIPPDGDFELMRYRVTDNINLPFRIIPAVTEEQGLTK